MNNREIGSLASTLHQVDLLISKLQDNRSLDKETMSLRDNLKWVVKGQCIVTLDEYNKQKEQR